MISLSKIAALPPVQRARKLYKIFVEIDMRCARGSLPRENAYLLDELCQYARFLSMDEHYSQEERAAFSLATDQFHAAWLAGGEEVPRRPVNTVRHMLARVVGKIAADWDFHEGAAASGTRERQVFEGMQVYLEDIRSPYNVGAMFRTAECFGVERVYLSPLCASPRHSRAERSAMGCVDLVPWQQGTLENIDLPVFVLETGGRDISSFTFPDRALMVAGSEELGASSEALARADASLGRLSIPMYGQKASLNVSVAFGIALNAWARSLAVKRMEQSE